MGASRDGEFGVDLGEEFIGKLVVGDGTCGGGFVLLDGGTVAGSFGEPDGTWDDDSEGVGKMATDLRFNIT